MQFNKCYQENFYFFTTYISEQIIKNVVKFKAGSDLSDAVN